MDESKDYKNYKKEPTNYVGAAFTVFMKFVMVGKIEYVIELKNYLKEVAENDQITDESFVDKYARDTIEWLEGVIERRHIIEDNKH